MTLSWTAPTNTGGGEIIGYDVYEGSSPGDESTTPVNSSPVAGTSYEVSGLDNGKEYYFIVKAVTPVYTSVASNELSATPEAALEAPGAPTIGTATGANASAVVNWTAPAGNGGSSITGYTVSADNTTSSVITTNACPSANTSTTTSCTVSGLTNGDTYTFTVAAINAQGTGSFSSPSNEVTPAATVPGAPTIGTATGANASAVVNWTAPSSNGGSSITGYTVSADNTTSSVITTNACPSANTSTTTSCTVSGLTNGDTYTFTVAAINAQGTGSFSSPSNAVTPAATVPGAPTIGTATGANASAVVNWTAPSSNGGSSITGYTVSADNTTSSVITTNACPSANTSTTTSCTVSGLTNGDTYTFTVAAINAQGTGSFSSPSNAVTPATTRAPIEVSGMGGDEQVTVEWGPPSSNGGSSITGYTVSADNTTSSVITTNACPSANTSTTTSCTVSGLTNGDTYTFTVAAINAQGTGSFSSPSNAVTPATVPSAPDLTSATAGNAQVVLDWTAPSSTGGSEITGYDILRGTTSGGESTTPIATVGTLLTYTDATVDDGTEYYYEVEAVNSTGSSLASNQLPATPYATDTITFNSEGGSAVSSISGPNGSAITLPAAPTYAGYTFDGWFLAASGGTALTSPYTLTGSLTLYAQWTANATDTITFNSEGGSAVSSISGPNGSAITLPAAPTYAGYTFDGWFLAASGGTALTSPYTLTGSLTLYAQWTANATDTVTFNSEGGSAVSSISGPNGSAITLPAAPTYAGYTFDGWFLAASGGTALTSPYTLTGSLTLYAQWTANATDTITFNSEGGSAGELDQWAQRLGDHPAGGPHLRRLHL